MVLLVLVFAVGLLSF